jgi:hypothetical protein
MTPLVESASSTLDWPKACLEAGGLWRRFGVPRRTQRIKAQQLSREPRSNRLLIDRIVLIQSREAADEIYRFPKSAKYRWRLA